MNLAVVQLSSCCSTTMTFAAISIPVWRPYKAGNLAKKCRLCVGTCLEFTSASHLFPGRNDANPPAYAMGILIQR
ncbi:hypothetical protein IWZ03DRAFT_390376 [Phyllosticta citriasiana]|uniref:Secreted protein n=1 Tax=Phyllosticta citriasiana TaxID=595635 RepID=A0ABR1K903_9PEZI